MTNFKLYLDECEIEFKVLDTQLGEKWWNKFIQKTPKDLETFSPASGVDIGMKTHANILKNADNVIAGLEHLIWFLKGHGYPIDGEFDRDNSQESLNRLHEHFPTNVKHQDNERIKEALKEYNSVIHWLELWDACKTNNYEDLGITKLSIYFKLNLEEKIDLQYEECTFDPSMAFGDICLGYPQAGKNFTEVMVSRDWDVPAEQILLHSKWSANVNVNFFDMTATPAMYEFAHKKYIELGGKEFFGRDWDDPRLGKGWIKVARLQEQQDREQILKKVNESSRILGWEQV